MLSGRTLARQGPGFGLQLRGKKKKRQKKQIHFSAFEESRFWSADQIVFPTVFTT